MKGSISFIEFLDDSNLLVNPDVILFLRNISNPISVISIAGSSGSGKSTFLNWLVDKKNFVKFADNSKKCVRGISLSVINILQNSGDVRTLLVLDIEGMSGNFQEGNQDSKIFSLAILLCSTFVFNFLPGTLDENSINQLSILTKLPEFISLSPNSRSFDENLFQKLSPDFYWLLRDFNENLTDIKGHEITATEYMEEYLQGIPETSSEHSTLRKLFLSLFPHRLCGVLARPVFDEATMKHIDTCPLSILRPEFNENLEDIKSAIFDHLPIKQIDGRNLTGMIFSDMIDLYVQSLNTKNRIIVYEIFEKVSKKECERLAHEVVHTYEVAAMSSATGVEREIMDKKLEMLLIESLHTYDTKALGKYAAEIKINLIDKILEVRKQAIEANYKSSELFCDNIYMTLFDSHMRTFLYPESATSIYETNPEKLHEHWTVLADAYYLEAVGPAKKSVFESHSFQRTVDCMANLATGLRNRYESQIKVLQVLLQNLETKLATKIVEEHSLRQSTASTTSKLVYLESKVNELTTVNNEQQSRIEDLEALRVMTERENNRLKETKERLEEKLVDVRAKLLTKTNLIDEYKHKLINYERDNSHQQSQLELEITEKNTLKKELETVVEKLTITESMAFGKTGSTEAITSFTEMQTKINDLQHQLRQLQNEKAALEISFNSEKNMLENSMNSHEEENLQKINELMEEIISQKSELSSKSSLLDSQEEEFRSLQLQLRETNNKYKSLEQQFINELNTNQANKHNSFDNVMDMKVYKDRIETILSDHRHALELKSEEINQLTMALQAVKKECSQTQQALHEAKEAKRNIEIQMRNFTEEKENSLKDTNDSWLNEKRKLEAMIQTQQSTLQSYESNIAANHKKISSLSATVSELELKDQMNVLTIEEIARSKKEIEDVLIKEKTTRKQIDKRLSEGLASLDTTSRSFQELQYAYESLQSEYNAQKATIDKLKSQTNNAITASEKLKTELIESHRKMEVLESEVLHLKSTIESLKEDISYKSSDFGELEGVIAKKDVKIAEAQNMIQALQTSISEYKANSQREAITTSTLASKIQQLDTQIAELQLTLTKQSEEVQTYKEEKQSIQILLEAEKEERLQMEEYLLKKEKTIENLKIEFEVELQNQAAELTRQFDFRIQEMDVSFEQELTEKSHLYDLKEEEYNKLQATYEQLVDLHADITKQLDSTNVAKNNLQLEFTSTKSSLEKAHHDMVVSYESTIASLKGNGDQTQSRLSELTTELQTVRLELQHLHSSTRNEKTMTEEKHKEEILNLNGMVTQLEKQLQRLEQQVQMQDLRLEASGQTIAEQKRTIGLLESSLSQRENMIQTRENTIQTRDTAIQSLEAKNAEHERNRLQLSAQCQSLQLKLDDTAAKLRDTDRSLEREKDGKIRLEERMDEIKRNYEDKLEDLRTQHTQRLQQTEAKSTEKINDIEAQKNKMSEEHTAKLNELNTTLASRAEEIHLLRREVAAITAEKTRTENLFQLYKEKTEESLKDTSTSFEATSNALVAKVRNLEEQILELSSQLRLRVTMYEELESAKKQLEEELAIVTRMRQRADEKIEVQAQRIELLESAKMNLLSDVQQKTIRLESHETVKKQLETQVNTLTQDAQRMDRALLEKMNQIESLKKTVLSHERLMEDSEQRVKDMEKDINDLNRSSQLQSNRMIEIETSKRMVEEMLHREMDVKGKLENQITKLEAHVADLLRKQKVLEDEREREHMELLSRLDQHMAAAGSTIEDKNKEYQDIRMLYEGLKKQHAALLEERAQLQQEYTSIEAERDALEDEMASLTTGFENRGVMVAQLEKELVKSTKLLEERQDSINQLESDIQELTVAFELRGKKIALIDSATTLLNERDQLKRSLEKSKDAVRQALEELHAKDMLLSEVESALQNLTDAYSNLQSEYEELCDERNQIYSNFSDAQKQIKALKSQIME